MEKLEDFMYFNDIYFLFRIYPKDNLFQKLNYL